MKALIRWSILLLTPMLVTGCGSETGPDSISTHEALGAGPLPDCIICHTSANSPSLDPLVTNGGGTAGKHTRHVGDRGIDCRKCHMDYTNNNTHMNGTSDVWNPDVSLIGFDATNPNGRWINDTGPQTGSCTSLGCHTTDPLDWYGPGGTLTLPACTDCHENTVGIRRVVLGVNGDFGLGATTVSHHVAGPADPTDAQCQVCHAMSEHMAGTVRLRNADTDSAIAYSPSVPSNLEPFCLSCHDALGATAGTVPAPGGSAKSPFADGRTLGTVPNVAGDKIAGYWNNTYTVHKDNSLTCAGSGEPGTGCHGNGGTINMHGSASKGLLAKNMTFPISSGSSYDYNDFRLCFDCHDNYPAVTKEVVLGYRVGGNYDVSWAPTPYDTPDIQSLFRDRYIANSANYPIDWSGVDQLYNDNFWGDAYTPLHNYHMSPTDGWMQYNWNYRGNETGRASCTTCHNVHGTGGTVRSTYDEFGITAFTGVEPDEYKKLEPEDNYHALDAYPIYCALPCHSIAPGTSYWHTPSDE